MPLPEDIVIPEGIVAGRWGKLSRPNAPQLSSIYLPPEMKGGGWRGRRDGTYRFHDATISFSSKGTTKQERFSWAPPEDMKAFREILSTLRSRGYKCGQDKSVHKLIRYSHYTGIGRPVPMADGRKCSLRFAAQTAPACCSFEFYQDVVKVNPHGGRYDFEKFDRMPYLVQKEFLAVRGLICGVLLKHGYKPDPAKQLEDSAVTPEEKEDVKRHLCIHDYNEETNPGAWISKDRKVIEDGKFVYFRDYHGRILRGKAFYNKNQMFRIYCGASRYPYQIVNAEIWVDYPGFRKFHWDYNIQGKLVNLMRSLAIKEDYARAARVKEALLRKFPDYKPGERNN